MGDPCSSSDIQVRMKRRRSSLFVEARLPSLSFDTTESNEEKNGGTQVELESYLKQLKDCKKSWINYEKELQIKLLNPRDDLRKKKIEEVEKHFEDYLDPEDKEFLEKASKFASSLSSTEKEISSIATKVECITACVEQNRESCEMLHRNLQLANRALMMKAIRDAEIRPDVLKYCQ